ncbi:MAG: Fur family transcriptional regulator [Desulfovibrionaceae bacterium]
MSQDLCGRFLAFLKARGLKETRQRRIVLEALRRSSGHPDAEEVLEAGRREDPGLSMSTVYRTLGLLQEAGLVEALNYQDDSSRYEIKSEARQHDHLICISCGEVVEIADEDLCWLQERMAERHGYVLKDRRMYLYGVCAACRRRGKSSAGGT